MSLSNPTPTFIAREIVFKIVFPDFAIFIILRRRVNLMSLKALPILEILAIPLTFGPDAPSSYGMTHLN